MTAGELVNPASSLEFPPFEPHRLVRGGHLQTVLPFALPVGVIPPEPERIEVELHDGDCVVLMDSCPEAWQPGDPTVLLMHGMAGCHRSHYMLRSSGTMCGRGWRTFRLDHRGAGAAEGLAERPYHGGRIEDVLAGLSKIAALHPESPLAAVGFSLSGNLLLKLIANRKDEVPAQLRAAAAVCPAIDLVRCSDWIRSKQNRFYDRYFARLLWSRSETYDAIARELPHLSDRAERPASLYEFDACVTAPLGGFESPEHYYVESSVFHDLPEIELPTLVLAAEDDPLIPADIFRDARYSGSTTLLMPASGGHLGFIGRRNGDPDRRWMDWRIIDWLEAHWAV